MALTVELKLFSQKWDYFACNSFYLVTFLYYKNYPCVVRILNRVCK